MNKEKRLAGVDAGHILTKAVIMRGGEILGYGTVPTGFDVVAAVQKALLIASGKAGVASDELVGIVGTGIFKDVIQAPLLNVIGTVPEYVADAKGAFFLNRNSRTVIDIGGNIHKAVYFDQKGDVLDVVQNDKCADGVGIFFTNMAKALGVSEQELSHLALQSTEGLSIGVQCSLSAESDALDLLCQGKEIAEVAGAISRYIVERVADMCTYMSLTGEVVVAGGLARSQALVGQLAKMLKMDLSVLNFPEYVGAIGAVMSNGGGK
jgi:predicted CoA-substrate-specific enzyme activase